MESPRPDRETERQRHEIVEELDEVALREDEALARIAETVRNICGVAKGHVSLMEDDHQCVVGHVGFEMSRFDRDETFCAHVVADNEVVIVEDAAADSRFEDNPFVRRDPGVRFYVGLPIVVGEAPVGTLCAIDDEPKVLSGWERSDLFGLVSALESHLEVVYRHGARSVEHDVSSRFTAIRADAVCERFREEEDAETLEALRRVIEETQRGFELLERLATNEELILGAADTSAEG